MKKIFSFTKKKKYPSGTPDNGSVLSVGYELKDKDLGKVHKAALAGDLAKLKQLAKKNDINQLDKENRTALHIACATGHVEVVQFLVESKAKLNLCDNQNRSALMKAVQGQHERCVSLLLENHAEPSLVDINGNTALHLAANIPSISTAVLLLEHEAAINAQNKDGFTPLTVAVREDHIEMAEFLLKEGADVNFLDQDQRSPLMIAAGNGQIGMLRLLLRFDADITLKDTKGWSADDYAVMNGHHPCSLLIIEHGTQRKDGASLSHQSLSKKKKKTLLGSPSQDVEAGFSLGGPATDKDETTEVKPKENDCIEKGRRSLSGTESEPESENRIQRIPSLPKALPSSKALQHPVDPSPISFLSKASPMTSTPLPSYRKDEDDSCAASVKAETQFEDIQKPSVTGALKIIDSADAQNIPRTDTSDNNETSPGVVPGNGAKTETQNNDSISPAETSSFAMPVTLDVEEDCVVSAIRVESKFSDEDESLGKECMLSSDQNIISDLGSTENPSASKVEEDEFERELEKDDDDSWSNKQESIGSVWNDSDDNEDKQTGALGRKTVLSNRRNMAPQDVRVENTGSPSDAEDDEGSKEEAFKKEKRRSSWGSSLEESEGNRCDSPKEEDEINQTLDQESDVQASDLKSTLPQPKDQPDSSWDSSSPAVPSPKRISPHQAIDEPKSSFGFSSTSTPQSKNRLAKTTVDESEWDSSSENHEAQSQLAEANVTAHQTGEEHCSDGSLEGEDKDSIMKESNDPSPAVSTVPEEEDTTRNQMLDDDEVESIGQLSQKEGKLDSENQKDDESSWDDEDGSDESEEQMAKDDEVADLVSPKSRPRTSMDKMLEEETEVDLSKPDETDNTLEDNRPEEEELSGVQEDNASKDDETSEDSDSKDQNLQYDFVSATVKVSGVGDDSDNNLDGCTRQIGNKSENENEARLTAYAPLENESAIVPQTQVSSDDLNEEPIREKAFLSPPTRDGAGQHHDTDGNTFSEEALPQTDIDDVDVDSPDEAENLGMRCPEVKNTEELVTESHSENPSVPHEEKQNLQSLNQEEMSPVQEEIKENLFYVPSFLRGEGGYRMAELEPWRSVGRPRGSQGEDASDWDTASTTSKRTLPGRRLASPGIEESPECPDPPVKEKEEEDISPAAPLTPRRSFNLDKKQLSSPQHVPHPTPRVRKMVLQKPESEEESDWEPDNLTSSRKTAKTDNQLQNIAELQAAVRSGSPEVSPVARDSKSNVESDEEQQKMGSDSEEKDNEFKDQHSPEEKGEAGGDVPWEKRYEKLWVEVEKREVKSTFKNVAGQLKELFKSRSTAEDVTEEEQATAESTSAEEESSDEEEEGEVIVRPTARARSAVLLTIPEQRESGLEDSESTDPPASDDVLEESRSPSPQPTTAKRDSNLNPATAAFTDAHTRPVSDVDRRSFIKDEDKLGPFRKQQLEVILKDTPDNPYETEKNLVSSEEDPEEFAKSKPRSLRKRPASVPGVPDEELEEDFERFKFEVGMLKFVFLDTEKEKAQLQKEVSRETAKTAVEVQKSGASWDTGGTASEGVGTEKPETRLGCRKELSSQVGATQQEQRPAVTKSTSRAPVQLQLPLQQTYSNSKQEGQAVVETLQLELVRGARGSRAPQTNTHVNGDPLSVFDDSTLSEVSDDEGRLPTREQQKNENPEEMEMAEDFDELTQSSDTATDDIDSPTSGYRHASLLIQKLDSATLVSEDSISDSVILYLSDSRSMVKLQNIFHEYERTIQKARSHHGSLKDKVSQLDIERAELKSSLEEVKDVKSALERNQLELQTEVANLKFQLKQEQENGRNATMMYNTTRDKLRRTEEQQQFEVQERQKVELTLRNLELEMRTLVNNMKQLEEDHSETQRLLAQERSARTLQENLLNSHLRKQQEIEEENKINLSKSNEALSQLTEASDRERELLQQNSTLQEQLSILRTDLERLQANGSLKERHLLEENEALKEQLEDARRDLKLNSDALTQTVFTCNNQMTTLKSELAITTTRLENERQARETLATEVESARTRLVGAVQEAERCQAAHTDTEKALLREKEEHQRLKDKFSSEAASQRESVSSLSQKLAKAESRANSMENEVHRGTLQLTEKSLLLDVLQREKDQAAARVKELETALQAERELVSRAGARQETTQERLAQAQSEGMLLRQQLEEAQNKGVAKERAVTDAQERFSDILAKLRSDCEERVQLVEERNKELAGKAADLRDQIYKLEEEKNERETSLRQLQQELADSLKKLSMSEASLEVNTRYRNDLEEEKARLLKDMDRLKGKLEESEDQYVQAERRINSLKSILDEREKELIIAAQKLQEALSTSATSDTTMKQLEDAVQRLEIENARLEAAAKQQSNKIDALQKTAQEAAMLSDRATGGGVRSHLEDLVSNLQSSKMTLEDQLSREVQKQSMLSHTAQDSQALWEEELKSRSKLRTLLKTAKKKLRDQDTGGAEFASPMSSLRMDVGRHSQAEGAVGRMKEKVDDLQVQLDKEASRRSQLEKVNGELKDQLASLKSLNRSNDQLERSKRQLEEEVLDLRRRMEASQMEQSHVEQYRREAEDRARQEIQQKLEQVNLFLQSQAASQEALDQIKAANEANLRSQMEQKIRELEAELGRARTTQQDSLSQRDSTRTELERYRQLYSEELRLRKSLTAKLDRANSRLAEANSKLLNERSRSFITSSFANGSLGGPSLDVGSLASPGNYGATLGPLNRSLGLGLSILSPVTEGQNSRVEDYLAKMQSELDRNISKELNNATAELDVASARMSPVGSASRVELDPVSRAKQQYLEVLKKNNMI
eukprot:superscaffoldBa00001408_g10404